MSQKSEFNAGYPWVIGTLTMFNMIRSRSETISRKYYLLKNVFAPDKSMIFLFTTLLITTGDFK